MEEFKSLAKLQEAMAKPGYAAACLTRIRWADGRYCPYCGGGKIYDLHSEPGRYMCGDPKCRQKFSITVGTIFENTKLPLETWFAAIWLTADAKCGIASTRISSELGIHQKSAWFMQHRFRHAAKLKSFNRRLSGAV